jgi:cation diffusion facilitator family transporter
MNVHTAPAHHRFDVDVSRNERRTRWVVAITLTMMALEVASGLAFGSMALLADGWHMATHAAALAVAVVGYSYARRHAADERFAFGTGKVGALAAFASAVGLAAVAVYVAVESLARIASPRAIRFDEAIAVASLGLVVNLACAALLHEGRAGTAHHHLHEDGHEHSHGHGHHHTHARGHDLNLRGAFLHVAADAVTSVAAIFALVAGKVLGWTWMDAVMGIAGALLIARWAAGLLRDASHILLDTSAGVRDAVVHAIEREPGTRVADLKVWYVGPRELAAVLTVIAKEARPPEHYRRAISPLGRFEFVAVEVHAPSAAAESIA